MAAVQEMTTRFERFLTAVEPERRPRVLSYQPISGGYSRISARSTVRWASGAEETFVLRGDPFDDRGVFRSDRNDEWHLMLALSDVPGVTLPRARWFDPTGEFLGSPCIVMDCSEHRSLQTVLEEADDITDWSRVFVDTVADIHHVDVSALPAGLGRPGDWAEYLESRIGIYDDVRQTYPETAPVLGYVARWLRAHLPPPVPLGLVHGDCQPGNVLVGAGRPLVIDWEFAHIGDPREDLGYYTQIPMAPNVYWADPPGFLERYRARTGLTEEQVNPAVVEYFLMIGMAPLFRQLVDAAAAAGTPERRGVMATYLVNAISHLHAMFLRTCDQLA